MRLVGYQAQQTDFDHGAVQSGTVSTLAESQPWSPKAAEMKFPHRLMIVNLLVAKVHKLDSNDESGGPTWT